MEIPTIMLLHAGHAKNEAEIAMTLFGFTVTLLGLGLAIMALWTRRTPDDR